MAIKDLLNKVAQPKDPNNPEVKRLREKLAALQSQGKQPTDQPPQKQPNTQQQRPQAQDPKPSAKPNQEQSDQDALAQLTKASDADKRAFAQHEKPRLRVKEERTHKLVAKQVNELISLSTDLNKRLKQVEQERKTAKQEVERLESHNKEIREKMDIIDKRLEKFMGLYEVITNQYNPFADSPPQQQAAAQPPAQKPANPEPAKQEPSEPQTVQLADSLTGQAASVPVVQGKMSSENSKKINQLLAELEEQEKKKRTLDEDAVNEVTVREEEISADVKQEIHKLMGSFEERLKQYLDESLQEKLHETFTGLEDVLNSEIRLAVQEELEDLTETDSSLDSALEELSRLQHDAKDTDEFQHAEEQVEQEVHEMSDRIKAIPPSLYFRLADGRIIKSRQEMAEALGEMSEQTFNHHARGDRNDFADWFELALKDPVGERLRGKSQQEMQRIVSENAQNQ